MPFGTITIDTRNFNPTVNGQYVLSTVTFGAPTDRFIIRGAQASRDGNLRASVTRELQKDIVIGSDTVRKSSFLTITATTPSNGFTAAEIDAQASDLASFLTVASITRWLMGES